MVGLTEMRRAVDIQNLVKKKKIYIYIKYPPILIFIIFWNKILGKIKYILKTERRKYINIYLKCMARKRDTPRK